ncbi:hypothetical protein HDU90_006389 [Geranomyces variabilis]|nr:hypothetical protein HDU90_006389 [Geranomyces variabilis]
MRQHAHQLGDPSGGPESTFQVRAWNETASRWDIPLGSTAMQSGVTYRVFSEDICRALIPCATRDLQEFAQPAYSKVGGLFEPKGRINRSAGYHRLRDWEEHLVTHKSIYIHLGDFKVKARQCTSGGKGRQAHGIHATDDALEDPVNLMELANLPCVDDA